MIAHEPAFMLSVVDALVWPAIHVEIEVVALVPAGGREADEAVLRRLNDDYIYSDQHGDVARYEEFLAEDFTATLPDLVFRSRREFLDLIARPRPFTGLTLQEVTVARWSPAASSRAGLASSLQVWPSQKQRPRPVTAG